MGQFPQQPLHYAGPGLPPVPSGPKQRRGWIIWLICIVAAVVVFLLLSKQAPDRHQRIPLSEFLDQLQLGRVARVVITKLCPVARPFCTFGPSFPNQWIGTRSRGSSNIATLQRWMSKTMRATL